MKQQIKLFMSIVIIVSAVLEGLMIATGKMDFAAVLLFTPAIAAWITKFVYFRSEKKSLLFTWCNGKYLVAALLLPLIYLGIPYVVYWLMNPSSLHIKWNLRLLGAIVSGVATMIVITIGEEIGWRGFLVPRLAKWLGMKKAVLLSGLIWGAWHCPLLISGLYMPGAPVWYIVPMFMIVITAVGVIIGILTLRSKSVLPAILMHAAHNNLDQAIFEPGTVGGSKIYFAGETGIITAVLVVIMAIWVYKSYKKECTESI